MVGKDWNRGTLANLPKWAQREIARLESAIEYLHKSFSDKMDEIAGKTETRIQLCFPASNERFAPLGTRVRFILANKDIIEFRLNEDQDAIHVYKEGLKHGGLSIKPEVSNVVEIS